MKALWIDEGNDPDYAKAAAYGMTALFFSIRDPRVTQAYLIGVRSKGYTTGVYVAWNWAEYESDTGFEFAQKVSDRLGEIVPITSAQNFPKVQLNVELQDPLWIQNMATGWRKLRKYRDTSWNMAPFQGGWMSPNMVKEVTRCRIRVVPQLYLGNMTPAPEQAVIDNVVNAGFPRALVTPMYDAATRAVGQAWDGFAFTQGRLPPV